VSAGPEPLLTLDEACRLYFPGKSACALRWMIKRRGYAHSRWGREYRLTPSQVAAIVDDLARPAHPRPATPASRPARRPRLSSGNTGTAEAPGAVSAPRAVAPQAGRRSLEARLSAPLSTPGEGA
jgi:hypothetical protein